MTRAVGTPFVARRYVALSALQIHNRHEPGALPQAITFRAFGADKLYFAAPASRTKNTWRRVYEAFHTCGSNFRDLSRQWL